uniref:Transmembrane protein 38B n=1 Tax=Capra hircus TaxID=9925 RepID=A0A8C2NUW3_CAPHI
MRIPWPEKPAGLWLMESHRVDTTEHQPGAAALAWKNPLSSWFTAMLHCFGGGILSCVLLAEPPLRFLANNTNILLASSICPYVCVCSNFGFLKVLSLIHSSGIVVPKFSFTHANSYYKNGWIVMIAIGWARGAGGSIITNFEQLVKGFCIDYTEIPAKVTLLGSVIFTFQQTKHLAISKHNLMFLFTVFLVATKITMMITETAFMPFACFEDTLSRMLFGWQQQFSPFEKKSETKSSFNGTGSSTSKPVANASDKVKKKHSKKTE